MIVAPGPARQPAPMCGHPEPPDLLLWLTLKCAPGVGPVTAGRLLRHFGDIRALFRARPAEFDRFRGGRRLWGALHDPETGFTLVVINIARVLSSRLRETNQKLLAKA